MRRLLPILALLAACTGHRLGTEIADAGPPPSQQAIQLCAHLRELGCGQRPQCEQDRTLHLATRDIRVDCLMSAKSRVELLRCGTVMCLVE